MTVILVAPGIEQKLKDINDTLKNIQAIMADDFSSEDASVQAALKAIQEAKARIPNPEPTTN